MNESTPPRGADDIPAQAPGTSAAGRGLCLRWAILSAVGLGLGLPAAVALVDPITLVVGMVLVTPVVFGIAGAILGTSQWFALRHLARAPMWIALCAVGLAIGLTAGTVGVEQVGRLITGTQVRASTAPTFAVLIAFAGLGGVGGLALGGAQWLYLRRWFEGGRRWVLASGAGMAAGMLIGAAVGEVAFGGVTSGLGILTALVITAATLGTVTGRTLERYARDAASAFRLAAS